MFFVNKFYQNQYRIYDSRMNPVTVSGQRIVAFDLYELESDETEAASELTLIDPSGDVVRSSYRMRKTSWSSTEGSDQRIQLDPLRGIVTLPYGTSGIVAMAYRTENADLFTNMSGSIDFPGMFEEGQAHTIHTGTLNAGEGDEVVILYPEYFNPSEQPYWDLQLRNVFDMANADVDVDELELRIREGQSDNGSYQQNSIDYRQIFYLDLYNNSTELLGSDGKIDDNWVDTETGYLWFPSPFPFSDRPESYVFQTSYGSSVTIYDRISGDSLTYQGVKLAPNKGTSSDELEYVPFDRTMAASLDTLYNTNTTNQQAINNYNSLITIWSEVRTGTEVFSLGWNVTNVTVTANGSRLVEGTDYELDEMSGIVRIINARYLRPDQSIKVSWESPELFQLRKKTFMGVKADLSLGDVGSLGMAYIYFNEESSESKVRLGNEPIKNSIFDINGNLTFAPRIMTNMVDALPLIEADAPSRLALSGEFAIILPDPNPSNNPSTGDNNGVAYVDDFESSKQESPVSLSHNMWFLSSKPLDYQLGYRGLMGWFNPREKTSQREIWPNYEESSNETAQNDIRTLTLQYYPYTLLSQLRSGADTSLTGEGTMRRNSWGGAYLEFLGLYSSGGLESKKFIEMTIKIEGDRSGTLHLDLGRMSEEILVNNSRDTEDHTPADNVLQISTEDMGLDGVREADPPWPLPDELHGWSGTYQDMQAEFSEKYDYWDINDNGRKDSWEPWSFDNYQAAETEQSEAINLDPDHPIDRSHGWQGNGQNDTEQMRPDDEDRNGDGDVSDFNSYFSWEIPLNPNDPDYDTYVSEIDPRTEWLHVRIPLHKAGYTEHGDSPTLEAVRGLRLWFSDFDRPVDVSIAEFNFVGNEWVEDTTSTSSANFKISVLNNFDNSSVYYSPAGVEGQRDNITGIREREQSMVFELTDMPFGDIAWADKTLDAQVSLAEYRRLRMFVHGGSADVLLRDDDTTIVDISDFEQKYNNDQVEFIFRFGVNQTNYYQYSKFVHAGWAEENAVDIIFSEITGIEEFTRATKGQEEPNKPILLSDGGQMTVVGSPSINNIGFFRIGIKNHGSRPLDTQIWFNELRVSDVKKEIGRAFRADLDADFSDVIQTNASFEQKDAEFHNVKQRTTASGSQYFQRNWSVGASTDLGRLLPPSWTTEIDISSDYSERYKVPRYVIGDDQELDMDDPPEDMEDLSRTRGASISFKKRNSVGFAGKQLLDRVSLRYSISEQSARNNTNSGDTTITQTAEVSYSNQWNYTHRLRPFFFAENWWLVGDASRFGIGYMPQSITLRADARRVFRDTYTRESGNEVHSQTYLLNRSWNSSLSPLNDLSVSFGRSYSGTNLVFNRLHTEVLEPLSQYETTEDSLLFYDYLRRLELWREGETTITDGDNNMRQTVDFAYQPTLVKWMTTSFNYNTSYSWQRTPAEPELGVSVSNSGSFTSNLKLKTGTLLPKFLLMSPERVTSAKQELEQLARERKERRQARREERAAQKAAREAENADSDEPTELVTPTGEEAEEAVEADELPAPVIDPNPEPQLPKPRLEGLTEPGEPGSPGMGPGGLGGPGKPGEEHDPQKDGDTPPAPANSVAEPEIPFAADTLLTATESVTQPSDSLGESPAVTQTIEVIEEDTGPGLLETAGQSLNRVRLRVGVALAELQDITATFRRTSSQSDPLLAVYPWDSFFKRHADLLYQLGLNRDTGINRVSTAISRSTSVPTRNFGYNYNLSTSLNVIHAVPISLSYSYSFTQGFSDEEEASRSEELTGWYIFEGESALTGPDFAEDEVVAGNPALRAIPDYNFSISGFEKLPLVRSVVRTMSMNHGYRGSSTISYAKGEEAMYRSSLTYSKNFDPLVGFDFSTGKGWSGSVNLSVSRSLDVDSPDSDSRDVSFSYSRRWRFSASKALRKGFKLPFIRKHFENNTTLTSEFSMSSTSSYSSEKVTESDFTYQQWSLPRESSDWSIKFSSSFEFSRNVTGRAGYEYGQNKTTSGESVSYNLFSVSCTIRLRGR